MTIVIVPWFSLCAVRWKVPSSHPGLAKNGTDQKYTTTNSREAMQTTESIWGTGMEPGLNCIFLQPVSINSV